jgi:hypothetical protein
MKRAAVEWPVAKRTRRQQEKDCFDFMALFPELRGEVYRWFHPWKLLPLAMTCRQLWRETVPYRHLPILGNWPLMRTRSWRPPVRPPEQARRVSSFFQTLWDAGLWPIVLGARFTVYPHVLVLRWEWNGQWPIRNRTMLHWNDTRDFWVLNLTPRQAPGVRWAFFASPSFGELTLNDRWSECLAYLQRYAR